MKYKWIKELPWKKGLEQVADTLDYLIESESLIIPFIKKNPYIEEKNQWPKVKNLVFSSLNRRIYSGGGGKSRQGFLYWTKGLETFGYAGKPKRPTYKIGDDGIPSHKPDIDIAVVPSGSTTSPKVIEQMKIFTSLGIKTFLITYTTPEKLEERRNKEGTLESAWDTFKTQDQSEEQVIYLPQRKSERQGIAAPLNTEFESNLKPVGTALADSMKKYHEFYEGSDTIPLKTISDTMGSCFNYYKHCLVPFLFEYQNQIYDTVQLIKDPEISAVRIFSPGINSMAGNGAMIRFSNIFDTEEKNVRTITSETFDSEGSSDLRSDTLLMVYAIKGNELFVHPIMREAKKKNVKHIVYIGNPKSESLTKLATIVIGIPWSFWGYDGVFGGLGPLGMELLNDAISAQVGKDLGRAEGYLRKHHSQHD